MDQPIRSARTRATWTIILVGLCSAVSVVAAVQGAVRLAQLNRLAGTCLVTSEPGCRPVAEATFSAADGLRVATEAWWVVEIVILLAAAIPWLMWQFRGHELLRQRLATPGLRITPGWAVGWWFVPFANLGMPAVAMAELWRASGGEGDARGLWTVRRLPVLFACWWAFWVARVLLYVVANVAGNVDRPSIGSIRTHTLALMLQSAATAVAGVLAIVLIRSIQARLELARPFGVEPSGATSEPSLAPTRALPIPAAAGSEQPDGPANWPPPPDLAETVLVTPTTYSSPPPGRASRPLAVAAALMVIAASAAVVAASPRIVVRTGTSAAPTASPNAIERFPTPSDWVEHPSPGGEFVIDAPPDWEEQGTGPDLQLVAAGAIVSKVLTSTNERLRVDIPLEQYVSLSVANIEKSRQFGPIDEVVVNALTLPAGPSELARFHVVVTGERVVVMQYYLISDSVAWILSYFGPAGQEDDLATEFEHMSSTFRFTD